MRTTNSARAYVRLLARIGGFYWVRVDGGRLLRGDDVDAAEQFHESFTETMARAGEPPPSDVRLAKRKGKKWAK